MSASDIANGDSDTQSVGTGVALAYVAAAAADTAMVLFADLDALAGIMVVFVMLAMVVGAEVYIKHLDMADDEQPPTAMRTDEPSTTD